MGAKKVTDSPPRRHNSNVEAVLDRRTAERERERKREVELAGIFAGYVATFLVCHTPRQGGDSTALHLFGPFSGTHQKEFIHAVLAN